MAQPPSAEDGEVWEWSSDSLEDTEPDMESGPVPMDYRGEY